MRAGRNGFRGGGPVIHGGSGEKILGLGMRISAQD